MALKYNRKMNVSLTGVSFTDESHSNVGASSFNLNSDWFINDVTSGDVLVIRTAAAGGGTLLVSGTDYTISNQHLTLSDEDHVNKAVYSDITINNAAYQATSLFFSGKYVADSVEALDVGQVTWQYEAKIASETLAPTGYTTYACTAGAAGIKLTLPAVSTDIAGERLEFIKTDDTNTAVMIDGSGAETINGLTHILLIEQYQKVELICTGTAWLITKGTLIADTGWINRSDWTNVHMGTMNVPYDNLAGTFRVGEIITEETSGNTWIILTDSGSNLVCWRATGTGYATNNKTITGSLSAATALVNTGTTTKDIDYNFYHGFLRSSWNISKQLSISTDGTDANSQEILFADDVASGNSMGTFIFGVDTSNIQLQTGSAGLVWCDSAGTVSVLNTQNYYYRIISKLIV